MLQKAHSVSISLYLTESKRELGTRPFSVRYSGWCSPFGEMTGPATALDLCITKFGYLQI